MKTLHLPPRFVCRRTSYYTAPEKTYRLPDGRIMYISYHQNPIAKTSRPYIAADGIGESGHCAYIPPLPMQILQKYPILNPKNIRTVTAAQLELARLLKIPRSGTFVNSTERLAELIDWLAIMYRLEETGASGKKDVETALL
ncbi:hypothetical protein [Methanorbis rubei]|uniref:Uncharacterized protein n=1 Tax=Methanorbis rubei TaxID=3028300 RepID=A0AAE4SB18_9EURY|nr:hypothetical protein [Methanocorpusculaceae archaeon Cs1]